MLNYLFMSPTHKKLLNFPYTDRQTRNKTRKLNPFLIVRKVTKSESKKRNTTYLSTPFSVIKRSSRALLYTHKPNEAEETRKAGKCWPVLIADIIKKRGILESVVHKSQTAQNQREFMRHNSEYKFYHVSNHFLLITHKFMLLN